MSGITTEFARHAGLTGRVRCKAAVIECDEAASRKVFKALRPRVVVVTNLFRDQLDRYGEIGAAQRSIREGIESSDCDVICLNADDSILSSLYGFQRTAFFGLSRAAASGGVPSAFSDGLRCQNCCAELSFDYSIYGHLGGWKCCKCGLSRPEPEVEVTEITSASRDSINGRIRIGDKMYPLNVGLPAVYNVYNSVAAICGAVEFGVRADQALAAASDFRRGFGRMESFEIGVGVKMILIKNPVGCDRALDYLLGSPRRFTLVICLNDLAADGRDISWIWDAGFERLSEAQGRLSEVIVSGRRAFDMALRLKYAGLPESMVYPIENQRELKRAIKACDSEVYILPTYTAMLTLRRRLTHRRIYKG